MIQTIINNLKYLFLFLIIGYFLVFTLPHFYPSKVDIESLKEIYQLKSDITILKSQVEQKQKELDELKQKEPTYVQNGKKKIQQYNQSTPIEKVNLWNNTYNSIFSTKH